MGMLRDMLHNDEQILWAEQTEIELQNFLKEFDEKVWPIFQRHGYTKDAALNYWNEMHLNCKLLDVINLLEQERL